MRIRLLIFTLAWLLFGKPVQSEENQENKQVLLTSNSSAATSTMETNWFDQTQGYLSRGVYGIGTWFDRFFGDRRDEEENIDRYVRIINTVKWEKGGGFDFRTRARARIQLPRFEERLNLILAGEDETDTPNALDDEETERERDSKTGETKTDKHTLALRWNVVRKPESSFSTSVRLPLSSLKLTLRGRYRYTYGLGDYSLARATQTVFWRRKEGFGETSRLDLEHLLSLQTLLRWSLVGTFSEISHGVDWGMEFSLFHNLSAKKAVSVDVATWGITHPTMSIDNYRLGFRYRQNIYRPWLFIELEPEVSWPKNETSGGRKITPAIMFRVELLFGRERQE